MNNWQRVAGPWTALFPSERAGTDQRFIWRASDGYVYDIIEAPNQNLDLANAYLRLFRYKEGSTSPEILLSIKSDTASYRIFQFTNVTFINPHVLFVVFLQDKSTNNYYLRYYRWNSSEGLTQWKADDLVSHLESPRALYATTKGNLILIRDTGGAIEQRGWAYPNTNAVVLGTISRPQNVGHTFYNFTELNGYLWWSHDNVTGFQVHRTTELVANSLVSYGTGSSNDVGQGTFGLESTGRIYVSMRHFPTGGSSIYRVPLSGNTLEFVRTASINAIPTLTDGFSGWIQETNFPYLRVFGENPSDVENATGDVPPGQNVRFFHGTSQRTELLVGYSFQLSTNNGGLWKLDLSRPSRLQTWPLGIILQSVGMRVYRDPP